MINKFKNKYLLLDILYSFIIFGTVFVAMYFIQFNAKNPYFVGEDAFYHVQMAKSIMQQGIISKFPYLYDTILNARFVDWHFLFHILLIPFIKIFGDIVGPKILTISILSSIFVLVYFIFKTRNLKFAFVYALLLFFIMPSSFYLRMSFIRAPVLSLLLVVLSIYLFLKEKPVALGIVFFIYMWSYYIGSVIPLSLIMFYLVCQIINREKINYQMFVFPIIGLIAGLVINPFFPNNLSFYLVQSSVIFNPPYYIGMELFPPNSWNWFTSSMMAIIIFFSGIFISLLKNIKQNSKIVALLALSLILLILQWKSMRFVEYWPVIGAIFGILLLMPYIEVIVLNFRGNFKKIGTWVVIVFILGLIQLGLIKGIEQYTEALKLAQTSGFINEYQQIANYLVKNSNNGDLVFTKWDLFPYLYYFDQKNYYIVGMDPTFLEKYDKKLFDEFIDITFNPESKTDLAVIKDDFHAQWVLAAKSGLVKDKLNKKPDIFTQVDETSNFILFKVK